LIVHQAIVGDPIAGVQAIEQVEGLSGEFQAPSVLNVELARQAHIGGGVVGPGEEIAARAGQSIVVAVVVLIGVTDDGGADRTPAAGGDDSRILSALRDFSEPALSSIQVWVRRSRRRRIGFSDR